VNECAEQRRSSDEVSGYEQSSGAGVLRGEGCRVFRMQRDKVGLSKGDLLMVVPDAIPEGGEYVIDLNGRVCRHGGGPVLGVIVGVVRKRRGGSGSCAY